MTYLFYSIDNITKLRDNEIFVFGSNLSGIHGSGAARVALQKFQAMWGNGVGLYGKSYAIPTKDENIITMPIKEIAPFVRAFKATANMFDKNIFIVTKIGCGLAGYNSEDIAPLFKGSPTNCMFHEDWRKYIE